jgi:hypothetical protein
MTKRQVKEMFGPEAPSMVVYSGSFSSKWLWYFDYGVIVYCSARDRVIDARFSPPRASVLLRQH